MSKAHRYILGFLVAGLMLAAGSVSAANLAVNPDFETWSGAPLQADGWINTNEPSTYVQSATAHGGTHAAQVTPTAAYAGIRQQGIVITGGADYRVTVWLRGAGTGGNDVVRLLAYTGGSDFFVGDTNAGGGLSDAEWRQYQVEFTAPAAATSLEIQFGAYQDPASNPISFYIDDVEVAEVVPISGLPANGNFEVWSGSPLQADRWITTAAPQNATYARTTAAQSGDYAAAVTPTATYAGIRIQNVPVLPETDYTLSFYIRGNGTGGDDTVRYLIVEQGSIFKMGDTSSEGGFPDAYWKHLFYRFRTDPGTTSIEIQFGALQDPATNPISFLLDDVELLEGTVPVELSDFTLE